MSGSVFLFSGTVTTGRVNCSVQSIFPRTPFAGSTRDTELVASYRSACNCPIARRLRLVPFCTTRTNPGFSAAPGMTPNAGFAVTNATLTPTTIEVNTLGTGFSRR